MCYLVNSEWLVKARGNQSSVRIELIGSEQLELRVARLWKLAGARSIRVAPWCSDLSPHWLNIVEDESVVRRRSALVVIIKLLIIDGFSAIFITVGRKLVNLHLGIG